MALQYLSKNALPKLARPAGIQLARYATVNTGKTQITTLPNGFTVASENDPSVKTATVGVWVNSGSRSETAKDNGSAHFLEHMAFKKNNLANSFMSFNTSYHDTGLWGIYMNSENITNLDDLVHFTLKEWARLSTSVTEAEVERAKQQLKASLLLNLDGTTAVAEDIGRQILTHGKRMEPAEVAAAVDAIDADKVRKVAYERLWDQEVAVASVGSIQGMPDFMRIRSAMSWMRA
ncbi:Mitochondrial-processing peptidase subunit beta [Linderina pennispora]|nr:Mitochondrial-processing peptidase subunit beta [Linderina pennispora]